MTTGALDIFAGLSNDLGAYGASHRVLFGRKWQHRPPLPIAGLLLVTKLDSSLEELVSTAPTSALLCVDGLP
jgi:hypothetical protein